MLERFINWFIESLSATQKRGLVFRQLIFVFLILPTIILGVYAYQIAYQKLTDFALERREAVAFLAARTLSSEVDRLVDVGVSLATRVQFRALIREEKWEDAMKILESVPRAFPVVDSILLADTRGVLRADLPRVLAVHGTDFSYRDWYQGVSKKWEPYVSEVYRRAAAPQLNVVAIAIPIKENGSYSQSKVIAILVLEIRLDVFFDWSRMVDVGYSGIIYFVDKNGKVVSHPKYSAQGEIVDFSSVPVVQKLLKGEHGVDVLYNPVERAEWLSAYQPISKYGYGTVVAQPVSFAFEQRDLILKVNTILFTVILAFNCFLAYLILWIVNEINLHRQREKIFLQSIGDGLIAIDRNWNITLFNKAASRLSEWSREEVLGKPLRNFIKFVRERDRKENIAFIEEALVYGRVGYLENHTVLITKSGKEIPVGDSASPIFGNGGTVVGAITIFRDVSKEREDQMLRSDFAYASHQFRTPISQALWSIETAIEAKNRADIAKFLEIAKQSLQSVSKLTEQLLTVSEIDQGLIRINPRPVKLAELLDEVLNSLKVKAKEHKIKLSVAPVSVAAALKTDQKLLVKILLEILDNAILYSQDGGEVKIDISSQGKNILIEVTDSGTGILIAEQPLVFVRFFRGSNFDKNRISGAGLGLFIARECAKLLGGKIWFKSEEKKGTIFSILLPIE